VRALGKVQSSRAIALLRQSLEEGSGTSALAAVSALYRIAEGSGLSDVAGCREQALGLLRDRVEEDSRPEVWSLAALALGQLSDEVSIESIRSRMRSEVALEWKSKVSLSLALLGDHSVLDEIRVLLPECRTRVVIHEISIALRLLGDPSLDESLLARAGAKTRVHDRLICLHALGATRSAAAVLVLIAILDDSAQPDVIRAASARALGGVFEREGRSAQSMLTENLIESTELALLREVLDWL